MIKMNLYLISQDENNGYDTCDSAVVAAPDENTALNMNPLNGKKVDWNVAEKYGAWAFHKESVCVKLIGSSIDDVQGVILASCTAS